MIVRSAFGLSYLGDGERRTPVVLEDVEANAAFVVNVTMVDLRLELDLRRLERVVLRELDLQEEHTALVRALRWTHDGRLEMGHQHPMMGDEHELGPIVPAI